MERNLEEYRSGKKSLELLCYVAGAGAFGVLIRWLQLQLAFNETGLADRSLLHVLVVLFVLGAAGLFLWFIRRYEKDRLYVSDAFPEAFAARERIYQIARIALGLVMCAGAALLYTQTQTDRNSRDYMILSILALLSGLSFPVWLGFANREEQPNPGVLCLLAFFPMLFLSAWLVICYKLNTINSVIWSYFPELVTVAVSMFAFFRLGGYSFGRPKWQRTLFCCMLAAMLCFLSLADERYLGLQVLFIAMAGEFLLCSWIMVRNFRQGAALPKKKENTGGFESL